MVKKSVVLAGKTAKYIAKFRGGGSALPGLIVEKLDPSFLRNILNDLPSGIVVISGTNGKTTTTKMVVELLESRGMKVFTNKTGSNFTRGVVSAILGELVNYRLDADIAVLELDEAHAVHFVREIQPDYCLLLNVLRDQLDRFGEIDTTAKMLAEIAKNTKTGVVLNREDPLIARIADSLDYQAISYFGYSSALANEFPNDSELHDASKLPAKKTPVIADVELIDFSAQKATYRIAKKTYGATLQVNGSHNMLNGAAALALVKTIIGHDFNSAELVRAFENVRPAFGRGETIKVNDQPLELILVKNPSGFRLALRSQMKNDAATMIAINDQYADGRDMSWLWDVDFADLSQVAVVSGVRAYDMALRLQYDEVPIGEIETNLKIALEKFLAAETDKPKQIFCTYTAMLTLRKMLSKVAKVEEIS